MSREISNTDEIIDSRDIIARITELEGQEERDDDEHEELDQLKSLAEEAEGYVENWTYGATLIHENYFTEYAEEVASDIGDYNPRNVRWPYTCIDWEKAAEELKQDYTTVDFNGETYYVR